jgi:hypothetical protein
MSRSKLNLPAIMVLVVLLTSLAACRGRSAGTAKAPFAPSPSSSASPAPAGPTAPAAEARSASAATVEPAAVPPTGVAVPSATLAPIPSATSGVMRSPAGLRTGLRSSPYGIDPFPDSSWWTRSIASMSGRFPGSAPATIWTVCEVSRSYAACHFPDPTPDETDSDIKFSAAAEAEPYLTAFDRQGIKVWLQVEPGNADVATLIDLVMKTYGRHPSVIGIGVDVEWHQNRSSRDGQAVTDAEAQAWVERTRTYGDFQVFLKHWLPAKMPPTYRDHLVFIDDSEKLRSLEGLVREFTNWGQKFAPSPVGFQYGYESDQRWWGELGDPPQAIGKAILAQVPNTVDLYWVDFTAYDIWPAR